MFEIARRVIKENEGFSGMTYMCSAGKLTIGYGHNLEARGISPEIAENILTEDMIDVLVKLKTLPYWVGLSDRAQIVLIDMAFQMGFRGLLGFKNMLSHIIDGEYDLAANELLDSKYAVQTKNRANRNAEILRTGKI